ncbi:hypothetical protein BLSTO_04611 [Blastocystis sp. subtype 1]
MSTESIQIDNSVITSLRNKRDELMKEKNDVLNTLKELNANIQSAIAKCPKRESGSVENLTARIDEMETEIETSSLTVKEEKELRRKIQEQKKRLDSVKMYANAQREIDLLKKVQSPPGRDG